MFYSVIHRPEVDVSKIEKIDVKYDPYHGLVGSHVTLFFPVPSSEVSEEVVKSQTVKAAASTEPFDVQFDSMTTELSWDQWLFLNPSQGKEAFEHMHSILYDGELNRFLREDISYSPHIAVGHFAVKGETYDLRDPSDAKVDRARYENALRDVKAAKIRINYIATQIELIGVDDDFQKSWTIDQFPLGKKRDER